MKNSLEFDNDIYVNNIFSIIKADESQKTESQPENAGIEAIETRIHESKKDVLYITGGIGSGKTWTLKKLEKDLGDKYYCIYLDMSLYASSSEVEGDPVLKFGNHLLQELNKQDNATTSNDIQDHTLLEANLGDVAKKISASSKKIIILLDGLLDAEWGFITQSERFLSTLATIDDVTLVISGRKHKYPWGGMELREKTGNVFQLKRFTGKDTEEFCNKWAAKKQKDGQLLILNTQEVYWNGRGCPGLTYFLINEPENENLLSLCRKYLEASIILGKMEISNETINYLRMLSVLDSFSDAHIYGLLSELDIQMPARKIRQDLAGYKFIQWNDEKKEFVMDESIRFAAKLLTDKLGDENEGENALSEMPIDSALDEKRSFKKIAIQMARKLSTDYNSFGKYINFAVTQNYASKEIKLIGEEYLKSREILSSAVLSNASKRKIFYVYGPGGVGKTKLIESVIESLNNTQIKGKLVASGTLDLFHTTYTHIDGLMGGICDALVSNGTSTSNDRFVKYREELEKDETKFISTGKRSASKKEIEKIWIDEYKALENKGTVFLAFDTIEKLFLFSPDNLSDIRNTEGQGVYQSLVWLFKTFIPQITNTVIVFSGRLADNSNTISGWLNDELKQEIEVIKLSGFKSLKDIKEYWTEVKRENEKQNFDSFKKLEESQLDKWSEKLLDLTGKQDGNLSIMPLMLAIIVDLAVLDPDFIKSLGANISNQGENIKKHALNQEQILLYNLAEELKEKYYQHHKDILGGKRDIFTYIRAARRGVNDKLLTFLITGSKFSENQRFLSRALIDGLVASQLSIIKLHKKHQKIYTTDQLFEKPQEYIIYLHDVMYELIEEDIKEQKLDSYRNDYYEKIIDYYSSEIKLTRVKVYDLMSKTFANGSQPKPRDIIRYINQCNDLALDLVYYQLDWSLHVEATKYTGSKEGFDTERLKGFEVYYMFAEESLFAYDEVFSQLLELELVSFLLDNQRSKRYKQVLQNSLLLRLVFKDAYLRNKKRSRVFGEKNIYLSNAYSVLPVDFKDGDDPLLGNIPDYSKYDDLITESDRMKYEEDFNAREFEVENTKIENNGFKSVQKDIILSRSYNNLGYYYRNQHKYDEALKNYQLAFIKLRLYPELEVQQAVVLLNISYALANRGEYDIALDWVQDAIGLFMKRGIFSLLGRAFNVLGNIKLLAGSYSDALLDAKRAQVLLQIPIEITSKSKNQREDLRVLINKDTATWRFIGLNYLLLAECLRRTAMNQDIVFPINVEENMSEKRIIFLTQASKFAEEAENILGTINSRDDYTIRACIERGCSNRDIYKTLSENVLMFNEQEMYFDNAEKALKKAIQDSDSTYREFDASINLAWLIYYKVVGLKRYQDLHVSEEYIDVLTSLLEQIYNIINNKKLDQYKLGNHQTVATDTDMFGLLGKIHMLRATIFYDELTNLFWGQIKSLEDLFIEKTGQFYSYLSDFIVEDDEKNEFKYIADKIQENYNDISNRQRNATLGELENAINTSFKNNLGISISSLSKKEGIKSLCLALEYNKRQKSTSKRDMRRAFRQTLQKIKTLNAEDYNKFKQEVLNNEERFKTTFIISGDKESAMTEFLRSRLFENRIENAN